MSRRAPVLLAVLVLGWAGCGSDRSTEAPAACLSGAGAYLKALKQAPGEVRLDGSTPISECLVPEQAGGELAQVGAAMVTAATRLNAGARTDPSGPAAVQLGYLVGAVQRGSEDTGGIHADLVRRLNAAARFNSGGELLPASFERTFGRGYAAGREAG